MCRLSDDDLDRLKVGTNPMNEELRLKLADYIAARNGTRSAAGCSPARPRAMKSERSSNSWRKRSPNLALTANGTESTFDATQLKKAFQKIHTV
jgi:hypothetical protein